MKKTLIGFLILGLLIVVLTVGMFGTGAWLSDTAETNNNALASATLKLEINNSNNSSQTFMLGNIKPGDYHLGGQAILKNAGSIPGHLWCEITNVSPADSPLGALVYPIFQGNGTQLGVAHVINQSAGKRIEIADLNPEESILVEVYFNWPLSENDNSAQGENLSFNVIWHLDQKP